MAGDTADAPPAVTGRSAVGAGVAADAATARTGRRAPAPRTTPGGAAAAGLTPDPSRRGPAAASRPASPRRPVPGWVVAAVPALAELVIGGYQIGRPSLWRDEAATIAGSRRPAGAIVAMLANQDVVHGPYYLLMHVVIAAGGTSPVVLRLPSLVAMCLTAAVTALLGRRLARTAGLRAPGATGLAAGLLLAAVPLTTRYAQEARPYALTSLFAVLASYALIAAATRRGLTWWAAYALAVAVTGMFSLFALLILAAHGVTLLAARGARPAEPPAAGDLSAAGGGLAAARGRRALRWRAGELAVGRPEPAAAAAPAARWPAVQPDWPAGQPAPAPASAGAGSLAPWTLTRWLAACAAALVVLSPMLILGARQRSQLNWVPAPGLGSAVSLGTGFSGRALLIPVALALAAAGAAAGSGLSRGRGLTLGAVALPWLILPPALLFAASLARPVYVERYVLFCLPAFALLWAAGLVRLILLARSWLTTRSRVLARRGGLVAAAVPAAAAALIALAVAAPQLAVRQPGARPDNLRAVAALLAVHERPGDAIVYLPWAASLARLPYPAAYRGLRDAELGVSPVASATLRGLPVPPAALAERLGGRGRVWALRYAGQSLAGWSRTDRAAARLLSRMRLVRRWQVGSVQLSLYARG